MELLEEELQDVLDRVGTSPEHQRIRKLRDRDIEASLKAIAEDPGLASGLRRYEELHGDNEGSDHHDDTI